MTTRVENPLEALTDQELADKVFAEISALCGSHSSVRKRWLMSIPVDFNRDSDVLFGELLRRFQQLAKIRVKLDLEDDES